MVAVVGWATLAAAACGGGDRTPADAGSSAARPASRASANTATTEPPATTAEVVQPYIEDLVAEVGESHDQLGADPAAVLQPRSELMERFVALHTPASEDVAQAVMAYGELAASGTRLEPASPDQPAYSREVAGPVVPVDRDTVEFATCTHLNHRTASEVLQGISHPGGGVAKRVDGVWLIEHLYTDDTRRCGAGGGV